MVDYEGAFKKPFQDITKLIIGIVLMIIPIVNFLSMGYFVETIKKTLAKDNNMPEWTNWGGLFVQGIVTVIIGIIYFIPTFIIAMIGLAPVIGVVLGTIGSAGISSSDPNVILQSAMPAIGSAMASSFIFLMLAGLVALITALIVPMAIVFYAKEGFGGAFKLGAIIKACLTGSYIGAWVIVMIASLFLTVIFGLIPLVGVAIAGFYMGIVEYTLFAQVLTEQGN